MATTPKTGGARQSDWLVFEECGITRYSRENIVVVSGSGDVGVSPRAEANVTINGSGDVSLGSRPARLTSELNGSGEILQD